jgi:drug/metabolite transporter (DMT)-like permease
LEGARTRLAAKISPDPPAFSFSAIVQLTLINLLWGASSVAAKYCLDAFGPFTLTTLRFLPAGLLLLGLAHRKQSHPPIHRADRPALLLLGAVGIALTYSLFYTGVSRTTATDSSLLFACEPILIALFARLFLHERLRSYQWIGLMVGLLGIWLITGQALGNRIALLALCFETTTSVVGKRLAMIYSGLRIVGLQMLIGSLLLLPLAGWEMLHRPPTLSWQAVSALLYLVLVCSALCYGIWYHLMGRFPISTMGVFILLQPVVGPVFGTLLRGETLRPGSAVGGALVVIGILLTSVHAQKRR